MALSEMKPRACIHGTSYDITQQLFFTEHWSILEFKRGMAFMESQQMASDSRRSLLQESQT